MTAAGWFWMFYICLAVTVLLWLTGCGDKTDVVAQPPNCPQVGIELASRNWYCEQAGNP